MTAELKIPDLKINTYYKYLLATATTVFVATLFFEVKSADVNDVRIVSFTLIICTTIIWIIENIIAINYRINHSRRIIEGKSDAKETINSITDEKMIVFFTHVIVWVIALLFLMNQFPK